MSLPVSQYEALLAQVRGLRRQAQHVQQLADPLLYADDTLPPERNVKLEQLDYTMDTLLLEKRNTNTYYESVPNQKSEFETSEDESTGTHSTQHSVSSEPISQNPRCMSTLYHGTWPVERTMWNSEPATLGINQAPAYRQMEIPSVMSFASSAGAPMERVLVTPDRSRRSSQQLEAKVDMVYSLLSMLGGQEHADMGETLLALSTNPESCNAMRQSGCIPLLVQLVQSDRDTETRKKASKALHNLVHSQPDEKLRKRETRILKLLETVCAYNEALQNNIEFEPDCLSEDDDKHPIQTIAHLMKLSFDEGHRQAICQLGGIHTIAELVEVEHSVHGSTTDEAHCILMRRYACMALTNLTFGDSGNKALLCSYKNFIKVLVVQLQSPSDELRQVTASVLRNLSWRADSSSKEILKEVRSVNGLMKSAMLDNKENTLKSILSALWNLSAHCTENKSEICSVEGSLAFLVQMLLYKSTSKSLAIIENSGGIIRNISSQIAVRDDYRVILREHNCLQILLDQLKSPSLTIVSNACGTLWNLSAKNSTDQDLLWQLGAPTMLRSLNHSKHKMIAMGSSATLKNLLSAKPGQPLLQPMDSTALSLDLPALPTLGVRKQKALLKDLDQNLSETFDNVDISTNQKKMRNKLNKNEMPSNIQSFTAIEYTSLDINEPSTSFSHGKKSEISESHGSSSLPYMNSDLEDLCTSTPKEKKFSNLSDEVEFTEVQMKANRKHSKSKSKSSISSKSSSDFNHRYRCLDSFSGYVEIDSDQVNNCFPQYGKTIQSNGRNIENYLIVDTHAEINLNRRLSKCSTNQMELRVEDNNVIDNDKHKTREIMKEIISNMNEKDQCSTEDISDSEVDQSQIRAQGKSELISLGTKCEYSDPQIERDKSKKDVSIQNNTRLNLLVSLGNSTDETLNSNQRIIETSSSSELPQSPTYIHPSPKPRKYAADGRPQPAPRFLPKCNSLETPISLQKACWREDYITQVQIENEVPFNISNVPTEVLVQNRMPNILKQEESLEDNTLQKEEASEKQDIGKEKEANLSHEYVDAAEPKEILDELQCERNKSTPSSSKTLSSSSNLQPRGSLRNNSGIPMSKASSRNSPQQCLSKTEKNGISSNQKMSNPCKIGFHNITNEVSNIRRKGKNEATEAPNMDSNDKCDISLCEGVQTSGSVDENCVFQISYSREVKISNGDRSKNDSQPTAINSVRQTMLQECISTNTLSEVSNEFSGITSVDSKKKEQIESEFRHSVDTVSTKMSPYVCIEKDEKSLENLSNMTQVYSCSTDDCLVFSDKNGERLERSCNDSANVLDTRMLDPDAMIESLDRFTAELVSQASSHLQNRDSLYRSNINDNTWDEHSSQNELTFPSISVSAPNVVSFKSDNENNKSSCMNHLDVADGVDQAEPQSNDFSSVNTSTMTESTLIAMEATKIAAAFREGADMSLSNNSLISLELDQVQPPSQLNSLSNSLTGFDSKPNSPRVVRKKSLPSNIMVRRALNHSLSHTSSAESLEHHYISNLDQINTPSVFADCIDMEGSTRSIPSLPSDGSDSKRDFIINRTVNKDSQNTKAPSSLLHFTSSNHLHSVTNIESINPPSLFNEITDMCNSLTDIPTSTICSETEVFEDCFTQIADNTIQTENDTTEFSDANSITPIRSDVNSSSSENTPKRQKGISKSLTSRQRRALAKERYKTYTIAAEMVMKESFVNNDEEGNSCSDNFKTACEVSESVFEDITYTSPSYTVDIVEPPSSKLSPKERRLSDRSRFQTQVVELSHLQDIHNESSIQHRGSESDASCTSPQQSPSQSPSRSKISVRKNCMQRRITNRERFKTQTVEDPIILPDPPDYDASSNTKESELYLMVEKEANKVLKTLRDTTINHEELLDCETLSLVSNEDESEHNSGGSVNYRTYHKSWGIRRNIPVISPAGNLTTANNLVGDTCENDSAASDSEDDAKIASRKPKIVKPMEKKFQSNNNSTEEEQPKGIRGRRKPLYSKNNINQVSSKSTKPIKKLTSNLVKNVTSTLRSTTQTAISKPNKIINKPPLQGRTSSFSRPISGSRSPQKFTSPSSNISSGFAPKLIISRPTSEGKLSSPAPLERQGTFTKDEGLATTPQLPVKTKIPSFSSRIPSAGTVKNVTSKIPAKPSNIPRSGLFKSASSERSPKINNMKLYNRSTSADSRESILSRKIQSSLSTHSLKSDLGKVQQNGAIKKIQNQKSNSNTSLTSTNNTKKQVTSKIASIWKKIEESKKNTPSKNDTKRWIEAQVEHSSDDMDSGAVVLRDEDADDSDPKRISRLGSFIITDENEDSFKLH